MKKLLIVYYSWSNGNTERIAKALLAATGADIARIETVTPHSGSYDDVVRVRTRSSGGICHPSSC